MRIEGEHYRTIWLADNGCTVQIIDQRRLPFAVQIETIRSWREMVAAIADMHLRGAPLIGAAAAYGVYLACLELKSRPASHADSVLEEAMSALHAARPTAVNLAWAIRRQQVALAGCSSTEQKIDAARATAEDVAEEDVAICSSLGRHGLRLLTDMAENCRRPLNILTHCNAGWLATVDRGTATAPIYAAAENGIPLHVWVDETRPRNQGALTAWELEQNGVSNTVICDNAGGRLMQSGQVDLVLVGTDRTARNGDVANKIGTYLKALAAHDNGVPFYVALPSPSYDPDMQTGLESIPIEERDPNEVLSVCGQSGQRETTVAIYAPGTMAVNPAFDVTPAQLVTAYITEHGVFEAGDLARELPDA